MPNYNILTPKEEYDLAIKAKTGDNIAREKLIMSNQAFVKTVIRKYRNMGLDDEDLFQEGMSGLIVAVNKFEPLKGYRLLSYAIFWIQQSILLALAKNSKVNIPIHATNKNRKLAKAQDKLRKELKRQPTQLELEKDTGISSKYQDANPKVYSLEQIKEGEDDNSNLLNVLKNDYINQEEIHEQNDLKERLNQAIQGLSQREIEILEFYYGLNNDDTFTLEEIAKFFGISRERVRQIKARSLSIINYKYGKQLQEYL